MSTEFHWNTQDSEVLQTLNTLGEWKALLRYPENADLESLSYIGLRSGAGLYCYDCNTWFHDPAYDRKPSSNNECPSCHKQHTWHPTKTKPEIKDGYLTSSSQRPNEGITTTCRFHWWNWPDEVYHICRAAPEDMLLVIDEYGRTMTGKEFVNMMRSIIDITTTSFGR